MHDCSSMGTLSALHLKGTLITLEHLGLDLDRVLAACSLTRAAFDNPFARFRVDVEHRLWAAIEQEARDPAFGLRVGEEFVRRGRYELDIYLALHSGTTRLAFQNVQLLVRLADDRGYIDVSESAGTARIGVRRDGGYPRATGALDTMFASASCLLHERLTGFRLQRVHFTRPRPPDPTRHRQLFGVEPRFDAPDNAIYFDAAWLDAPLQGADLALGEVLLRYAQGLAAHAPRLDPLLARVQHLVSSGLSGGDTSLASVARATGTSPRTLRRRLTLLGTSFQGVLDQARRDFAARYLLDEQASVADVAERVGFASVSAFQRAFQRWFGQAPSSYRARHRGSITERPAE